jgi:hypothetical protein
MSKAHVENMRLFFDRFQRGEVGPQTPPSTTPSTTPPTTPPPKPPRPPRGPETPIPTRGRLDALEVPDDPLSPLALSARLSGISKRLVALQPEVGDRTGPIDTEHAAIGELLSTPGRQQDAKDRLDALEPQVVALEVAVAAERKRALEKKAAAELKVQTSKQQVTDFLAGRGPQHVALTQKAGEISGAIDTALASVEENKSKVTRKGLVFDSKDKEYHAAVTTPLNELLPRVKAALDNPAEIEAQLVTEVRTLQKTLQGVKKEYADLEGVKSEEHRKQRKAKVDAITQHVLQLQGIGDKLVSLRAEAAAPMLDALQAVSELGNLDSDGAQEQAKSLGTALADNPAMRTAVLDGAKEWHARGLALAVQDISVSRMEPIVQDVIAMAPSCNSIRKGMATSLIRQEAEKRRQVGGDVMGSFFRVDTAATKFATAAVRGSPKGGAYLETTQEKISDRLGAIKDNVELDPSQRPETNEEAKRAAVAKAQQANVALMRGILADTTSDPSAVPLDVAELTDEFYQEALRSSGGDEQAAVTAAGGFLMLRLINPLLAAHMKTLDQQIASTKKKEEKQRLENQKRAATQQMILMQNLSNGVKFGAGGKKAHLSALNVIFENPPGTPAPEYQQMRQFLKDVSTRGARAKGPIPALDTILANPAARTIFRAVMEKLFCAENLDYWVAVNGGKPSQDAAQQIYDRFISTDTEKPINSSNLGEFHVINGKPAPKPWNEAPWDEVLNQIMKNFVDCRNKIKLYPDLAEQIKQAV